MISVLTVAHRLKTVLDSDRKIDLLVTELDITQLTRYRNSTINSVFYWLVSCNSTTYHYKHNDFYLGSACLLIVCTKEVWGSIRRLEQEEGYWAVVRMSNIRSFYLKGPFTEFWSWTKAALRSLAVPTISSTTSSPSFTPWREMLEL